MEKLAPLKIIGISTETTNKNGKASEDLGKLWERFFSENIAARITNKKSEEIYSIYTDYESDYTGNYKAIIGFSVDSLDNIPHDLIGRELDGGKYQKFVSRGNLPEAVATTWKDIWEKDKELDRSYTADFEVYGEKSQNGDQSEVDIFIATK